MVIGIHIPVATRDGRQDDRECHDLVELHTHHVPLQWLLDAV